MRSKRQRYTLATQSGVVTALVLGVILVASEPTRALVRAACEASFEPTAIPAGAEAATVFYQLTETIGELEQISAQEGSGVVVSGHDLEMSTLSLNTIEAKPGTWTLIFEGQDDQTCQGSIDVAQPADART